MGWEPHPYAITPTPTWPTTPPPKRNTGRWLAGAVVIVVCLGAVGAAAYFAFQPESHEDVPKAWDPKIAPIAHSVESLRGRQFKHPVKVNYLANKDFEAEVTSSPEELKEQREEIDQATGLLRATGLIGGDVDLAKEFNTTTGADTIAFYNNETKQIYVRGTGPMTVETRVTLAHELTHALQDQSFDLQKLKKRAADSKSGSSDALTALIEGDAVRIQDKYLEKQPAADRLKYAQLSQGSSGKAQKRTEEVSAVVETFFGAPYIFGPQVVRMIDTIGGNRGVDAALNGPTPSTRIFFDPTSVNDTPKAPAAPELQDGEKKIKGLGDDEGGFDSFLLYLMFSARLDRPTALLAADAFASGSLVAYEHDGVTCFRAAVDGISDQSQDYLATVLKRWVKTMPGAVVEGSGAPLVFHSCDPGKKAAAPSNAAIREATTLAASRDALASEITGDKIPSHAAVCIARLLVQNAGWREALLAGDDDFQATPQLLDVSRSAATRCRSDVDAGLP